MKRKVMVVVSSLGSDDVVQELCGIGTQAVLFKPLTREALLNALK